MPDEAEQLGGASLRRRLRHARGRGRRIISTICQPDRVVGVQARERVLEDHPDLGAPDPPQHLRVGPDQVDAVEARRPGDPGAAGQPGDGLGRDALARAGLPDDGEGAATVDVEGESAHGLDDPVGGV